MNEFEFIDKYFKPLTSKEARGLIDDAALYKPKLNTDIVISTDSLAEGIHFLGNENPKDIAKKCLRVNLSDMAAMGAKPIFYNLAISVPKNKANIFIPAFAQGLKEDQETYNLKLIGGDLTASLKHINITITIFGETSSNQALSRDGAKINDFLYVTGYLGLSKVGLDNFSSNSKDLRQAKQKYLLPQPRVNLGMELRNIATSMIDVSDGLVQDATHLAINSNLSLELNVNQLPLPSLKSLQKEELLNAALYGGDDYELLFSCKENDTYLEDLSKQSNVKITKIGVFKEFQKVYLIFKGFEGFPKKISYSHF
jgi:thiamine-monophosphate kinase